MKEPLMSLRAIASVCTVLLLSLLTADARAFCGFYVSGAKGTLTNEATQVVMMREGTKTVLSMRNSYKGPAKDFAMVVPVPVILKEEGVKVLEDSLFDKVDRLSSPRLVKYWEQDPCPKPMVKSSGSIGMSYGMGGLRGSAAASKGAGRPKVVVEAKFDVGEYNVVILSATESNALESWLVSNT